MRLMTKYRIIEVTKGLGSPVYYVQYKDWWLPFWFYDKNCWDDVYETYCLDEAKRRIEIYKDNDKRRIVVSKKVINEKESG